LTNNIVWCILYIDDEGKQQKKEEKMNQLMFEQGNPETRKCCNELRKAGYKISVSSLGYQVTNVGLIKTTMVTVYNADGKVQDIVKGRDFYSRGI